MKKIVLSAAVLLLAVTTVSADGIFDKLFRKNTVKGSGDLITVEREIEDFTRLKSTGSFDVEITVGEELSCKITFDDNLVDLITTEVSGRTLEISNEESYSSRRPCKIEITVPKLEEVRLSGSGEIDVYNLDNESFEFKLSGSGEMSADGKTDELEVTISGSGNIDTSELQSHVVYARVSGSGDITTFADEEIDAVVTGSGDIRYYGEPEYKSVRVTGSGSIRKKR